MTDKSCSPDIATVTELHKQAASMFLCWPTNAIDLAQKDSDLPQLIDKLAQFIATWERKGSRATAQCSAATTSAGYVLVPRELTAENGAKSALIGEFSETFDYMDDEGDECQAEIPVSWTTIKAIHKKMVERFGVEPSSDAAQPSIDQTGDK